jgi:DNA adenine methylase
MIQKLLFNDEEEAVKPVNVASVPLRSPFRYPGGKTWFVPRLREWISSMAEKPRFLVEPFAGGGIISLTAAFESLTGHVVMSEIDEDVAAVWETVLEGDSEWLSNRILNFELTKASALEELSTVRRGTKQKAFQTILKNRIFHGGILANGSGLMKSGESNKGITSRWYPKTLAQRFRDIDWVIEKLTFYRKDAFEIIDKFKSDQDSCFFIDPPYTAGGKNAGSRLYKHHALDHDDLFYKCSQIKGDFIMTYDNSEEVKALVEKYNLKAKAISMRNTHNAKMSELVIGRDLSWLEY